jgi:hypothetical protein
LFVPTITIGIVLVAFFSAWTAALFPAMSRSTFSWTSWAAISGRRSMPPPDRCSIRKSLPST